MTFELESEIAQLKNSTLHQINSRYVCFLTQTLAY